MKNKQTPITAFSPTSRPEKIRFLETPEANFAMAISAITITATSILFGIIGFIVIPFIVFIKSLSL